MEMHVVRLGETLSKIAHRHGTTWQVVARLNALKHPGELAVGQRLRLPAPLRRSFHDPDDLPVRRRDLGGRPDLHPEIHELSRTSDLRSGACFAGDITERELRAIMPHSLGRSALFVGPLNMAMRANGIDTIEKKAAFLAQLSVESGDLRDTEENLDYSAERLHKVWPRRFPTIASATPYAHNPEALGNRVYANRLGNGDEASGDGYLFRGRGLIQTTGRSNYRAAGYENKPDDLANPDAAADSAARFWSSNGLNRRSATVLTRSGFDGITLTVNGGLNGSDRRWLAYGRAINALIRVKLGP